MSDSTFQCGHCGEEFPRQAPLIYSEHVRACLERKILELQLHPRKYPIDRYPSEKYDNFGYIPV